MLSLPIKLTRAQTRFLKANNLVCVGTGFGHGYDNTGLFKASRPDGFYIDLENKVEFKSETGLMGNIEEWLYFVPRPEFQRLGLTERSDLIVPYVAKPRTKPAPTKPVYRYAQNLISGHIEKFNETSYQNIWPTRFEREEIRTDLFGIVDHAVKSGEMKELTHAEFVAQINKWGMNEDGTKIIPPAPLHVPCERGGIPIPAPSLNPSPAKKKFTDKNSGQVWHYPCGGQNYRAHICMFSEGDMLPFDIKTGLRIDDTSVIPPNARMVAPTLADFFKNKLD